MAHVLEVMRVRSGRGYRVLARCECGHEFSDQAMFLWKRNRLFVIESHAHHISMELFGGHWMREPGIDKAQMTGEPVKPTKE